MRAMNKFLISAGFAVAFVACSSESSTQATPTVGKSYIGIMASTRCDNTDKDSPCNETSKALRKVNSQNGNFTTVATVIDDPSGSSMTVRWKDLNEKFITVPGSEPNYFPNTTIGDSAFERTITYQATEILSGGTDAKFAPIYKNDEKYCEETISGNSLCIALYPASTFWTDTTGHVLSRVKERLLVQQYKEYTSDMRDSVIKYHHMVGQLLGQWETGSDATKYYRVSFAHLTSFVEVDLPRTGGIKIVGIKTRESNSGADVNYEVHFENAISSGSDPIRIVFAVPFMANAITGELAFYTKTSESDNAPVVYKKKLSKDLTITDSDGMYWSIDFSTLTGVTEEQNSSSSSDQSSSSQGGSEEPENPEESSSSQASSSSSGSDNPNRIEKDEKGHINSVTFNEPGTFTVYIGGPASGYCQINCQSDQQGGGVTVSLKVNGGSTISGYNAYWQTQNDGCYGNFSLDVDGTFPIKCTAYWN